MLHSQLQVRHVNADSQKHRIAAQDPTGNSLEKALETWGSLLLADGCRQVNPPLRLSFPRRGPVQLDATAF